VGSLSSLPSSYVPLCNEIDGNDMISSWNVTKSSLNYQRKCIPPEAAMGRYGSCFLGRSAPYGGPLWFAFGLVRRLATAEYLERS
jgi:hypothetical protein